MKRHIRTAIWLGGIGISIASVFFNITEILIAFANYIGGILCELYM